MYDTGRHSIDIDIDSDADSHIAIDIVQKTESLKEKCRVKKTLTGKYGVLVVLVVLGVLVVPLSPR